MSFLGQSNNDLNMNMFGELAKDVTFSRSASWDESDHSEMRGRSLIHGLEFRIKYRIKNANKLVASSQN